MISKTVFKATAPLALAIGASGVAIPGVVHAQISQSHQQLTGTWLVEHPIFAVKTADGAEPPLIPEAATVYRERQAARKNGDTSFDSATWCSSLGTPRMMFVGYPFELVVRPQHVAILSDWNWWARIVYMPGALDRDPTVPPAPAGPPGAPPGGPPPGGPPPGGPPGAPPGGPPGGPPFASTGEQDIEPTSTGFSKGHWEGDTLVVETDHLLVSTLLDSAGLPHSPILKITERLHLVSPDVLENRIRFEDPATLTQPWETVVTYRRQTQASRYEDVCLDRIKADEPAVVEAVEN